jgi:uncharacterized protein (DUF983 family)
MCAEKIVHTPGLLRSMFTNKCPRCRQGRLFTYSNPFDLKHMMQMPENCPVCGQHYEIEVGFFYGTGFVSYALSVIVCIASFIIWKLTIGMSLHDNRLFWWIGVNGFLLVALQPVLMRMSRAIWLYFFVWYDPEWEGRQAGVPERTNQSLKNDW